jgi:hypothetical protein
MDDYIVTKTRDVYNDPNYHEFQILDDTKLSSLPKYPLTAYNSVCVSENGGTIKIFFLSITNEWLELT